MRRKKNTKVTEIATTTITTRGVRGTVVTAVVRRLKKNYCKKCLCRDCNAKGAPGDKCVKSAKKTCALKEYKGDGNCDDGNNNAGCAWDGGDCCGPKVKKAYCKLCQCRDCTYKSNCPKKGGSCGDPQYVKDGNCDDGNNNCACNWDGGDCCGKVKKNYCKICKCLDPTFKKPACGSPQYKGDGNCDDENNIATCAWDKGDCCGVVKKNYCKICKCLDPGYKPSCGNPKYKKDGNCDDENNNAACEYDGGDCCGVAVKKNYCKICKCLDPNPKKGCALPQYKKDGNCDDGNNIKECDFDGGDCCKVPLIKTYCKNMKLCKCLDPNGKKEYKAQCANAAYKGDGNCDDGNNNSGCGYDGGDCCKSSVKGGTIKKNYCKDCSCVDPKYKNNKGENCNGKCTLPKYKNDGNCDDVNNNCGCGYDGGDCCPSKTRPAVKKTYCKECVCINYKDPSKILLGGR